MPKVLDSLLPLANTVLNLPVNCQSGR
jgi:hypothetical protein